MHDHLYNTIFCIITCIHTQKDTIILLYGHLIAIINYNNDEDFEITCTPLHNNSILYMYTNSTTDCVITTINNS